MKKTTQNNKVIYQHFPPNKTHNKGPNGDISSEEGHPHYIDKLNKENITNFFGDAITDAERLILKKLYRDALFIYRKLDSTLTGTGDLMKIQFVKDKMEKLLHQIMEEPMGTEAAEVIKDERRSAEERFKAAVLEANYYFDHELYNEAYFLFKKLEKEWANSSDTRKINLIRKKLMALNGLVDEPFFLPPQAKDTPRVVYMGTDGNLMEPPPEFEETEADASQAFRHILPGKTFMKITLVCVFTAISALFIVLKYHHGPATEKMSIPERPPVAVEAVIASTDTITDALDVVGTLSPKFQTDVNAEYPGVVKEVYVTEWVKVKKGEKLVSFDTREPEAQLNKVKASKEIAKANLLEAEAAAQSAQREYKRIYGLIESGLITQQAVDAAKTQKEVAFARQSSAKAMLSAAEHDCQEAGFRFSKMVLYSPIDGVVAERRVNVGDLATGRPLFRIVDNQVLDLTMTIPSKFIRFLKTGLVVQFTTEAFPGKTFSGKIKNINPVMSDVDRSAKVVAEVDNDQGILKGGLFVEGKIITGERKDVMTVHRSALIDWDLKAEKASIFIVDNGIARKRDVTVGVINGERVEIISGLSPGDKVIGRAGFNIKDGDKVRLKEGK